MRPCVVCGEPSDRARCSQHAIRKPDSRAKGYDTAWTRLSKRARRLQPFCTDCGTTEDLQADHTPEAWRRKAEGKPIRLQDIAVVCGPCNRARGAARGRQTRGVNPPEASAAAPGKEHSASHFPNRSPLMSSVEGCSHFGTPLSLLAPVARRLPRGVRAVLVEPLHIPGLLKVTAPNLEMLVIRDYIPMDLEVPDLFQDATPFIGFRGNVVLKDVLRPIHQPDRDIHAWSMA